jgi:ubiquinone/menaquinone biosynthesis C-methylase UbiE
MKQQLILDNDRFNNPEFVKKYSVKHSEMSKNFADKIAAKLSHRNFKGDRILDAGCGSGLTLIELAKRFPSCECYGIDLSDPLLEIANNITQKEKLIGKVKFLNADVQDIPFFDSYFDVVININMLHLIKDPLLMLNEIERILKLDGFFFIADLRRSVLGFMEKEIKHAFNTKEAKEIIGRSNLVKGKFSSDLIWWRYQNI